MALERLSVTPTPTPTPCSLDARLDLGALCVAQCSGEGAITCYRIDRAGNAPNQTAHVTLGIPTGDPSTGNPLDPSVPLEATGDVGIHPFVNVKHVQFTPDGSALIAAYFDRGLEVYPTLRYSNGGVVLEPPVLHGVGVGDTAALHRPFSFAFSEAQGTNDTTDTLIHVVDVFASPAARVEFPPLDGLGRAFAAGGRVTTYKMTSFGGGIVFEETQPGLATAQAGMCWIEYSNGVMVTSNTKSGTLSVFRAQPHLGEGIFAAAEADLPLPSAPTGLFAFDLPFLAPTGGLEVRASTTDITFSSDGLSFYVLNTVLGTVEVYDVDRSSSSREVLHLVESVPVPDVGAVTSEPAEATSEQWRNQIKRRGARGPAMGMQGIASYPRAFL